MAAEEFYTQAAREYLRTNDLGVSYVPRDIVIQKFNLEYMNLIFTSDGLDRARWKLAGYYLGSILVITLSFCLLVLAEATLERSSRSDGDKVPSAS